LTSAGGNCQFSVEELLVIDPERRLSPFYAQASYSLGYDNTDELTSGSATGSSYGYSYDAGGNR